ncbi:MAG: AtpZ/AtpI family protein [Methylococcales bacterium]|nr:AtpZ/AtpI family protein [Methylococcales bacterium]
MNSLKLKDRIENQVKRIKQAQREKPTLVSQTTYITTLGLMIVLPIVGGAYLGHWIDSLMAGYSIRWTITLLLGGVVMGFFNVYFLIKD